MQKVAFYTQGCKINIYDTEVIKDRFFQEGKYQITNNLKEADIIVINSCTVTEKADNKFRNLVHKVKKNNPNATICAVGCLVHIKKEQLLSEIPEIDYIADNYQKFMLPSLLSEEKPISNIDPNQFFDHSLSRFDNFSRAFIKVQDGCNNRCTYCTIPQARGKSRSKPLLSICKEVGSLSTNGYNEIVISGIDLGSYKDNEGNNLFDLLQTLISQQPNLRIRLSSIEPWCFDNKLISLVVNSKNICPHLHISLQSGSDKILKSMKRKYNMQKFNEIIHQLSIKPHVMISTDIIVGFPGETEKDFLDSMHYLENSPLTYAHIFSYSDRELALASKMPDKINPKIIAMRSKKLRQISENKKLEFYRNNIGLEKRIIIEKITPHTISGITDNYIPIQIPHTKKMKLDKKELILVKITDVKDSYCLGNFIKKIQN